MKFLQKAISLMAATVLAAGVASTQVLAESTDENTYPIYIVPSVSAATPGDIVSIKVCADTTAKVSALTFDVIFDSTALEYQSDSVKKGNSLTDWSLNAGTKDASNGKIIINLVSEKPIADKESEIIEASFKVLKPNGTMSIVLDVVGDVDGNDVTNLFSTSGVTIKCSHKNTETKTTPSTCVAKGKEDTVCKDCGETVATKELELAEHTWDEGVISKTPTCTEDGEKTLTCSVCGETKTETVDAVGHKTGESTVTKEPTCTAEGQKASRCENCGEVFIEAIPATGHTFGEWEIDKEATCTEEGYRSHSCVNCTESETEPIPPAGHTFGEWIMVKEPTETESGIEERECSVCGKKGSREVAAKETDEAPATTPGSSIDKPSSADKDIANTGVASVAAIAGIAAIAAAAVVIAKKRK